MDSVSTAVTVARLLNESSGKVIFVECCTSGIISATFGQAKGSSTAFCGAFILPNCTHDNKIFGIKRSEDQKFANVLATKILAKTPLANWCVCVAGCFGPDAPVESSGKLFMCIARRTKKNKIKKEQTSGYVCSSELRPQIEATEAVLSTFARTLQKRLDTKSLKEDGLDAVVKTKKAKRKYVA